jgi:hypothetical protein
MAVVDHERVLVRLRAHIATKASHGRDQLLRELALIEADCMVPEGMEGFDGVPLRRAHPVERHESAHTSSHDDTAAEAGPVTAAV